MTGLTHTTLLGIGPLKTTKEVNRDGLTFGTLRKVVSLERASDGLPELPEGLGWPTLPGLNSARVAKELGHKDELGKMEKLLATVQRGGISASRPQHSIQATL